MRRFMAMLFAGVLAILVWQAPASVAAPAATRHIVMMSAQEVVPGPGDPDGDGDLTLYLGWKSGRTCWFLNTTNVAAPLTAVHLHRGAVGEAGEQVALLHGPNSDGDTSNCKELDRTLVRDIVKNLGNYYIDVHNQEFPDGALRGQLDNGAPMSMFVGFDGEQVVPGPGDPNGSGGGNLGISGTELCFSMTVNSVALPLTAVHLHRGAAGETGEQVAVLHGASSDYAIGDCVDVGADLANAIANDKRRSPEFYIDVHNAEFPAGAVRSQLR